MRQTARESPVLASQRLRPRRIAATQVVPDSCEKSGVSLVGCMEAVWWY
jgi:hypothetical protein